MKFSITKSKSKFAHDEMGVLVMMMFWSVLMMCCFVVHDEDLWIRSMPDKLLANEVTAGPKTIDDSHISEFIEAVITPG